MPLDVPVQAAQLGLRRFSVAEYHRLTADGFFAKDSRFELLDGHIVRRPSPSPIHATTIHICGHRLAELLPAGWEVHYRSEVTLADSAPEPDVSIVRDRGRDYFTRHPNVGDLGLVIDVADAALLDARRDKTRIYAADGVPSYWIVNVAERQIEVYMDPQPAASPSRYASRTDYRPGATVPLTLGGARVTVRVDDLLP